MGILMVTADTLYVHPIRHSTLETRRQLELKCIPQLFLVLLATRDVQISDKLLFLPSLLTVPEVNSAKFYFLF